MSTSYDYIDLNAYSQPEDSTKYFGLSVALHVAMLVGAFFIAVPAMDELKKEIITIELQTEEKPPIVKQLAAPKGEKVADTKGAERVLAPAPSAPIAAEEAAVIAGPVQKSKLSKAKAAQIKTHVSGGDKSVAKSAVSRAGVPETLDDIAAPELEEGVDVAQIGNLGDNEFENEFKNIDRSNAAAIRAQQAELDEEAKQVADEKDAALQALEEDNAQKAKAMEDALAATRTKNAAVLAQLKATERAAAEKAAREKELAAVAAAKNRGAGNNAASNARGNGNAGTDQAANEAAGEPHGVRSLEQLRQMPGNPKPFYSMDERLRRQAGVVAFHAFITKEGQPTQFRLIKTTGFRNLDGKTLAALKKWKFYPGQQGWVEIPFKWDINGDVQEMPTALRRTGSKQ